MAMADPELEEEIFKLCSDSKCPRDIQFHCEKFTEYAAQEKSGKAEAEGECKRTVKTVLQQHFLEEFQTNSNNGAKKFYCSLCGRGCETIWECLKHVMQEYHQNLEMVRKMQFTRDHLPNPSSSHCVALKELLSSLDMERGISTTQMQQRVEIIQDINLQLKQQNINATLEMYGSSLTGLGFCDADLNATVIVGPIETCPTTGRLARASRGEEEAYAKTMGFFQNTSRATEISISPFSKRITMEWIFRPESGDKIELTLNRSDKISLDLSKLLGAFVSVCPFLRPLVLALRTWAKLCEVDDVLKEGLPPYCIDMMVIYFLQKQNLLPVIGTMGGLANPLEEAAGSAEQGELGRLWVELLKFYSDSGSYDAVISITGNTIALDSSEKKLTFEDPVTSSTSKKSKFQISVQMTDYIRERLCAAYVYFATPRTKRGPIYDVIIPSDSSSHCSPYVFHKSGGESCSEFDAVDDPRWDLVSLAEEVQGDHGKKLISANPFRKLGVVKARLLRDHRKQWNVLLDDVRVLSDLLPDWLYKYEFSKENFQQNTKPPVYCKSCQSKQHYLSECKGESRPEPAAIPGQVSEASLVILSDVLKENYEKEALTEDSFKSRQTLVDELQKELSKIYPHATLKLFGSTVNGFGTPSSDIDICLILNEKDNKEQDTLTVITRVNKMLFKMKEFQVIYFVRHARVPIVKFRHRPTKLEGDISCSNPLAVHNSELLRTYAEIDVRVKIIGYFFKKLVKVCDISSASKSTLSSYGHTLMVLYFLQQLETPVIPVLQELPHEQETLVNGWNVEYYKNIEGLKSVWPDFGRNEDSPAELWIKLLQFYTEEFDFDNKVISIRQKAQLTRLSKFWISESLIAIEDPLEFSHNIGNCLSRKKSVYILNTFWKFRQVFQTTYGESILRKHRTWLAYFTDPRIIQYKAPSRVRKCAVCHCFDHQVNDCPRRRKKRKLEPDVGQP